MDDEKIYSFTKRQLNEEKIRILSKFASVASHDLKNVVGSLSNVAYYLSRALKVENETQKKMLSMLSTEVVALNKRITEILDMTRVKQLVKGKYDLQDIIISLNMSLDNNNIITKIVDCGQGMNEETLEDCFDPMFSTKLAKSIGMGLTVARQIIEMHNGSISISSKIQKGTTVVVSLPILQE